MGADSKLSPAKVGEWFLLVAILIALGACAAPPVPLVPNAQVTSTDVHATLTQSARTFTPTTTLPAVQTPATAEPMTRPIVNTRVRGVSPIRALRFCEVPQTLSFRGLERVYCLHPETISFEQVVTALGEVMNDRFALRDANGNELVYDVNRRCEFNLCYAYVWYDKRNAKNAYALLRLYPLKVNEHEVAPLLELGPDGSPEFLGDWQIVFVNTRSGAVEMILPNPFVPMARSDTLAYNAASGYFEVLDRSGQSPKPTGKRLGLPFAAGQATELTGVVDEIALYNFDDADVKYLENSLTWLEENLPSWYEYLMTQRPFEIDHEPSLPFVSDGICCRTRNGNSIFGRIRFRDHMHDWTRDSFPGGAHDALARWSLLTLLIHEATHVRDLRTDRFRLDAVPSGMRDCVMHISTDEIEILFSKQAAVIRVSPSDLTQREYAATIQEFYNETETNLLPEKKTICGDFYHPTFDGLMP